MLAAIVTPARLGAALRSCDRCPDETEGECFMPRILRGCFRLGLLAALAAASLLLGAIPVHASRPSATNGGTLTIGATSDALTLDATLTTDEASGPVEDLLFNSLVRFNAKVQIVPDLASSWTISNDGKTYTFHLRPHVTF